LQAVVGLRSECRDNSVARPTEYTPILAERICELIGSGETKKSVTDRDDMPARSTLDVWLHKHDGFADMYARAREKRTELFVDELIEISDDASIESGDKRVRVDTRKWLLSKILPRQFGDSLMLKGDPKNPLHVARTDLSEKELMSLAAGERALDG
jgi:hypothetical protein